MLYFNPKIIVNALFILREHIFTTENDHIGVIYFTL